MILYTLYALLTRCMVSFSRWFSALALGSQLLFSTPAFADKPVDKTHSTLETKVEKEKSSDLTARLALRFNYQQISPDGVLADIIQDLPVEIDDPNFENRVSLDRLNVLAFGIGASLYFRDVQGPTYISEEIALSFDFSIPGLKLDMDKDGTAKDIEVPGMSEAFGAEYDVSGGIDQLYTVLLSHLYHIEWGKKDLRGGIVAGYGIGLFYANASAAFTGSPKGRLDKKNLNKAFQSDTLTVDLDINAIGFTARAYLGVTMSTEHWFCSLIGYAAFDAMVVEGEAQIDLGVYKETRGIEEHRISVVPGVFLKGGYQF